MMPPVMAQIVATLILLRREDFVLDFLDFLVLRFFGEFGLIINGIRNYVGLVIFGVIIPQFDFQERQKMVHLLVKLDQIMHVEHVRVKVVIHVRNGLFGLFFLFFDSFVFLHEFHVLVFAD